MKGNDGTGNVSERDDWQTPQWLFDELNKQYKFNFDCCATSENSKTGNQFSDNFQKCDRYMIQKAWMNPPFSNAELMFKSFFRLLYSGIAIYRCDNIETKIWQDIIFKHASWILVPKGRISYEGKAGKGSRFPSALIGYNVDVPKHVEGTILYLR